jgi:hypothetical protein
MDCIYCGKPATHRDLCHGRVPVCDAHAGIGHQVEALPTKPAPKPARR